MDYWNEAISRVGSSESIHQDSPKIFPRFKHRIPVVITGASGVGKTELFRLLTGKNVPDGMSLDTDKGWRFVQNQKKTFSLMTIPGQPSKERNIAQRFVFGSDTHVEGIIHLCSYGFNEIWPKNRTSVIQSLNPHNLEGLIKLNKTTEVGELENTLKYIFEKIRDEPKRLHPSWLVILVNKADLFWDKIDYAKGYYHIHDRRPSRIKTLINEFNSNLGNLTKMHVEIVPFASNGIEYNLRDVNFSAQATSKLSEDERKQLNSSFFTLLEDLSK